MNSNSFKLKNVSSRRIPMVDILLHIFLSGAIVEIDDKVQVDKLLTQLNYRYQMYTRELKLTVKNFCKVGTP